MNTQELILNAIREEGRKEYRLNGVRRALKQGILSPNHIADLFEVTTDFVLKIQKEEEEDI